MGNLIQYFSSFDKLMKEKLVAPLFWLLVIWVGVNLLSEVFDMIGLDVLDNIIDFLNLFFAFIVALVAIRVVCELAVAIFRINDNLSPDHGVSETADIDPVAEARRAAEDAARRARIAADQAMERTQSLTRSAVDSTKAAAARATARTGEVFEDVGDSIERGTDTVKSRLARAADRIDDGMDDDMDLGDPMDLAPTKILEPQGKVSAAEAGRATPDAPAPASRTVAKKRGPGRPKGSKTVYKTDPVTGERLKKDGTPARKPGPKPKAAGSTTKSKSTASTTGKKRGPGRPKGSKNVVRYDPVTGARLKKDGTPAKKPGPKPKP